MIPKTGELILIPKKQMFNLIDTIIAEKKLSPIEVKIKTNLRIKNSKYKNEIVLVFRDEQVKVNNAFYHLVALHIKNEIENYLLNLNIEFNLKD